MKPQIFDKKIQQTINHFKEEISKLRTGTADPSLIEEIKVEAYEGQDKMPIRELGTINSPDPSLMTVEVWDQNVTEKVLKAIEAADNGLNPMVDGEIIKVPVPELNEEQRKNYVSIAKEKLENARITIRNIRQDAIKSVEEMEDNGKISEDEMHRQKEDIEGKIKEANKKLNNLFENKKEELMKM